jgi:sugar O-acyltransferase (sialic acid O-acetyltransferase NeuD family)
MADSDVNERHHAGVLVIGAGGHGKSVIGVLQAAGYGIKAVIDDDPSKWGTELLGFPVVSPTSEVATKAGAPAILAIGDNAARQAAAERFKHLKWITLVYPGCYVHPTARLGPGTLVHAGSVLGPEASIGAHVIISAQCTVGHDSLVGDYAQLTPGVLLGGEVRIGKGTFLGMGSVVIPGIQIGDWAVVGAGGVVVHDLPDGCKAIGMPARPVQSREILAAN